MQLSNSWFHENIDSPQCCLIPFFSHGSEMYSDQHRNKREFIFPPPTYLPLSFQKVNGLCHNQQKHNILSVKRSISSLKDKHPLKKYNTHNSHKNTPTDNISHNDKKAKSSIRNSNGLQRYFSPQVPHNNQSIPPQQSIDRKKVGSNIRYKKQLDKNSYQIGKLQNFLKKQHNDESIQFQKYQNCPSDKVKLDPENYINCNLSKLNQTSIPLETYEKLNTRSTGTHFNNSSRSKYSSNNLKTQKIDPSTYVSTPKTNPQQVLKYNHNKKNGQNQIFDKKSNIISLQNILEQKKQEARQQSSFVEFAVDQLKNIDSFVVGIKKQKGNQSQQKNYRCIKAKGREVESMVQMSNDLAKTKKIENKRKQEPGLHELQNITVTSQYDDEQIRHRVQKIQESAVLLNFFNPPKDLKERLGLSKHGKSINGRSGIY